MSSTKPHILVVDDDPAVRIAMNEVLKTRGYTITTVNSSKEGLTMVDEEDPLVVITDLNMPELDGYEFIRELRGNLKWAKIKILAISAMTLSDDIQAVYDAGADDFLGKPFSMDALIEAVENLIGPATDEEKDA